MSIKPIKVWGHWGAPNPWKVCIVLETLKVPYEIEYLELNEVKTEAYLKVTPNARLPTIEDPNTGITLWEVCQVEGLCERHDNQTNRTNSLVPSFSTWSINTIKKALSRTLHTRKNTSLSNGWHSSFQVCCECCCQL